MVLRNRRYRVIIPFPSIKGEEKEKKRRRMYMKTKITGFHQDEYKQWVADLSCGHSRHFRHDPPFQLREWVTSPQGRNTYIGFELDCKTCGGIDV